MYDKNSWLIFNLFRLRVFETSRKYGMGAAFIKGQLDEAYHQLTIRVKKQNYGERHEL